MNNINRFMTNDELLGMDDIREPWEHGHVIVIDKQETRNGNYAIYSLGSINQFDLTHMSNAELYLNNKNEMTPIRCISFADEFNAAEIEIGKPLNINNERLAIRIEDSYDKSFEEQPPRMNSQKDIFLGENDKPIYRLTRLVFRYELDEYPHRVLKVRSLKRGDVKLSLNDI